MMQQEQVNVVESQAFQSFINLIIGIIERGGPELRGDEDLLTLDTEILHGATNASAHAHLIAVDVSRVDESHADFQRVIDRLFCLGS